MFKYWHSLSYHMKKNKHHLLKIYYWVIIIVFLYNMLAILLFDLILKNLPQILTNYLLVSGFISAILHFGIFIFSIIELINFKKNKFQIITLIIPIYTVIIYSTLLIGLLIQQLFNSGFLSIFIDNYPNIIFNIIRIVKVLLSGYILYKFRK